MTKQTDTGQRKENQSSNVPSKTPEKAIDSDQSEQAILVSSVAVGEEDLILGWRPPEDRWEWYEQRERAKRKMAVEEEEKVPEVGSSPARCIWYVKKKKSWSWQYWSFRLAHGRSGTRSTIKLARIRKYERKRPTHSSVLAVADLNNTMYRW